jgi:uncharacterized membrane protein
MRMKRTDKRWLQTRLDDWVAQDLMRTDQAEAIRQYQERQPAKQLLTFFGLLVGVGAVSIGVGIILVVSYNWEEIPPLVRQIGFLLALVGFAEARLRMTGRGLAERGLDVVWVILPLAGIGLWGQVYQLSGDAFKPLAVTLGLALPIVWLGANRAAASTHAFIFSWAMFLGVFEAGSWISMRDPGSLGAWFALALCVVLWIGMLYQTREFAGPNVALLLWVTYLVFLFSTVESGPLLAVANDGMYFVIASALGMLFWAGRGPLRLAVRQSGDLGWVSTAMLLYVLSFLYDDFFFDGASTSAGLSYGHVLSLIAIAGVVIADVEDKVGLGGVRGFKLLLGLPLALSGLLVLTGANVVVAFLANVALIGYCLHGMHAGVLRGDRRMVNQGVAVVGLLMVTRFIDYFGSFLTSGSAFIVMGLLFLGMAYGLNRGRQRLLEQVMEASAV